MNNKRLKEIILEIKAICMTNDEEIYKLKSILDMNQTTINFSETYGNTLGTVNQIYLTQQKEMLEKENKNHYRIINMLIKELESEEKQ